MAVRLASEVDEAAVMLEGAPASIADIQYVVDHIGPVVFVDLIVVVDVAHEADSSAAGAASSLLEAAPTEAGTGSGAGAAAGAAGAGAAIASS